MGSRHSAWEQKGLEQKEQKGQALIFKYHPALGQPLSSQVTEGIRCLHTFIHIMANRVPRTIRSAGRKV
jgi:hypothetical protein